MTAVYDLIKEQVGHCSGILGANRQSCEHLVFLAVKFFFRKTGGAKAIREQTQDQVKIFTQAVCAE